MKKIKLERSKNTKRNIIIGMLYKIITILLPFILRAVMIKELGINYLGLNSFLSSVLQVLNLAELGFSNAIVYCMYQPIAENDNEKICALLNYYRKIYKKVGIIILVLGGILAPFLDFFIKNDIPREINIYIIYWVYVFNTSISYILCAYKNAILNAYQRVDIINLILLVSKSILYIIQIGVLILSGNYYLYIILMPIFTMIENVVTSFVVDKRYPNIKCKGEISIEEKGDIYKNISGLMITKVCHMSRTSIDSIFVTLFLGLSATAIYNNYYYVMNSVTGLMSIILTSLLAGIGNSISTENINKNYKDMRYINCIYMYLSGWTAIVLLCLYQPFMEIWLGRHSLLDEKVMLLFPLYYYLSKMGDVRSLYSDAAGLWWENRIRMVGESFSNVILNILLGYYYGIAGILLATIISIFIFGFILSANILFKNYFKEISIKEYFLEHMEYAIVTSFNAVICYWLCTRFDRSLFGFIKKGIICILFPNFIYLIIYGKSQLHRECFLWVKNKLWKNNKF